MIGFSLWKASSALILASQSAARFALLTHAGLAPTVLTAPFDERVFEETLSPAASVADRAIALASEKARLVSIMEPEAFIIGADQILDCDGQILHKAKSRKEAEAQLAFLSARHHRLTSAVAVCRNGKIVFVQSEEAALTMRILSTETIGRYCDAMGDQMLHTVGGYELEGLGVHLFEKIEGSYFAILGLPLEPLLAFFRSEQCLALS